jgi:WD40 repeat protein
VLLLGIVLVIKFTRPDGSSTQVRLETREDTSTRAQAPTLPTSPRKAEAEKPAPAQAVTETPLNALKRSDVPEVVLTGLGQGDPRRAPADLVAVLGDGRFRLTPDAKGWPALSPDGTRLAVPSGRDVRLFDTRSGQLLRTFRGQPHRVAVVTFSPDGKRLAAATSGPTLHVRVWDADTGHEERYRLGGPSAFTAALAFSPDGRWLAYVLNATSVQLLDLQEDRLGPLLRGHTKQVWDAAFSPDGKTLAAVADDAVRLWDAASGAPQQTWPRSTQRPVDSKIRFSPDGSLLAVGADDGIQVWDVGSRRLRFERATPAAGLLDFSRDGTRLVSAPHWPPPGPFALSWTETAGGKPGGERPFTPVRDCVYEILSRDGNQAFWLRDGAQVVKSFDVEGPRPAPAPDLGSENEVLCAAISPDGRLLASGGEGPAAFVWDVARRRVLHRLVHPSFVFSVRFSRGGDFLLTLCGDGLIRRWDLARGQVQGTVPGHSPNTTLALHPSGSPVAAGTDDGSVRFWDTGSLAEARPPLHVLNDRARSVAFSPDGKRVAVGGAGGKVVVCEYPEGKVLKTIDGKAEAMNVCFSPDGQWLAASYAVPDPVVRVVGLTRPGARTLIGHTGNVNGLAFGPDGKVLMTAASDGTLRLWDLTGREDRQLVYDSSALGQHFRFLALSADGRHLAVPCGDQVRVYRLPENIPARVAAEGVPPPDLVEDAWQRAVTPISAANQVEAVRQRLRWLNPGFDGPVHAAVDDGAVVALTFGTDQVTDLRPVRALPGLRRLVCRGTWWSSTGRLSDLGALKGLSLEMLDVSCNRGIKNLTPLRGMPLRELWCDETQVNDLRPLQGAPLRYFHAYMGPFGGPTMDLASLEGFPLEELMVGGGGLRDLTGLKGLKLKRLHTEDCPVADLSPLAGMELRHLWMHNTQVSDLAPLRGMPLETIKLYGCPRLSDLSPLKEVATLRWINDKPVAEVLK